MDFQANRATVLKGDLSQYRYVHFATHGLLDSERPGLSSLVLSMVDAAGQAAGRLPARQRHLQPQAARRTGRVERLPDGTRQRDQRRRAGGTDARVYVCRRRASRGQSVERQRQSDRRADDEVLREDAEAGRAPGGGVARRAGRDVEAEAMAVAVLLGGVHHAGRVALVI